MKSSLKIKAPFITTPVYDFGFGRKIITVSKLPITMSDYQLKCQEFAKVNNIELKKAEGIVQSKLIQIEAFNKIMDHISSLFEFKIDPLELKDQFSSIKNNPAFINVKPENKTAFIEDFAKKSLMKHLIFNYFVSHYNQLEVSIQDAEFVMMSNAMLDKIPDNQKEISIRNFQKNAIENKIIEWLIHQYKIIVQLEKNNIK